MTFDQRVKMALAELQFTNLALAAKLDEATARIAQLETRIAKDKTDAAAEKKSADLKVVGEGA